MTTRQTKASKHRKNQQMLPFSKARLPYGPGSMGLLLTIFKGDMNKVQKLVRNLDKKNEKLSVA